MIERQERSSVDYLQTIGVSPEVRSDPHEMNRFAVRFHPSHFAR